MELGIQPDYMKILKLDDEKKHLLFRQARAEAESALSFLQMSAPYTDFN
jgi:hypothetical protein